MQIDGPSYFKQARLAFSYGTITLLPRKAYWNKIIDGLYLGAMPIETLALGFGNHGHELLQQCNQDGKPLKLVISANEQWELDGYGFMGLKPVPSSFWWEHGVEHRIINFEDFGAKVPIANIKAEVDAAIKCIEEGGSAYIHCKAGRGRSFVITMCYLMDKLNLNPQEAFEHLISKRPHIGPSISQFEQIEEYRAQYKPDLTPLKLNSPIYTAYRKDLKGYAYSPTLHGTFMAMMAFALGPEGPLLALLASVISGTTFRAISSHTQATRIEWQKQGYIKAQEVLGKTVNQEAYDAGTQSIKWSGWFRAWGNTKTYGKGNYEDYLAGLKAAQEKMYVPLIRAKL